VNSALEIAIWSAMTGVILVLACVSVADFLLQRSVAAARGVAFIVLTGLSSVLMSGLPQALFTGLDEQMLLPFKAALGPLSGALALAYLGLWVRIADDERLVRRVVSGGGLLLVVAAAALAGAVLHGLGTREEVLGMAAVVNGVSVVCAAMVALRAATLGDSLARWMSAACICLAGMVAGLYAKGLGVSGFGTGASALTAICTVAYFLVAIGLTVQRNRELRRIKRLAMGSDDEALGLPSGVRLVSKVDDAIWRSARVKRECVVVAVSVVNLLEPDLQSGARAQSAIVTALTARIRRVVGFRNVVGLYHPRCFILAVSAVQDPRRGTLLTTRLLRSLRLLVRVKQGREDISFEPAVGIGVVRLVGLGHDALKVINKAEQLALLASQADGMLAVHWDRQQDTPDDPVTA
jgi:hypothetical protein